MRRAAAPVALLMGALVIIALAFAELHARGTSDLYGGIGVADYRAHAVSRIEPAPDFTLPALDGSGPIRLSSLRGHVVVLNFFASWCGPCRLEAPGLVQTSETYRRRGVRFLGVDARDNDPAGRTFVAEFGVPYPAVSDPAGSLADNYRLYGMPTTFVIDASGTIRFVFVGYVQASSLQGALDAILAKAAP